MLALSAEVESINSSRVLVNKKTARQSCRSNCRQRGHAEGDRMFLASASAGALF
jgi:hypothetical protein